MQGLSQRQCCCKTVIVFPWVVIPHLELSPDHQPVSQPTDSWSSASCATQELSAGFGGPRRTYGIMGQEQMAGCALCFEGLRRVRGLIKINIFNNTE